MQEWQMLCSRAIWIIIGIFAVPAAMIQIGRCFYYLGIFPKFNKLVKVGRHAWSELVDIFYECPAEFVIYATAVITVVAIAVNKI